ncbi:thioredoxin domain-containing protein [Belliella baltica DSM 15883]|uniref:Thioredoxin domain-containing protein n=1 Tax=Belliella baltica (strain DSM 15883 / CIP 108006 / LMG 21964 / BA134) TaxID=866536 RepID=I3Z137_BELBD|nr:thioredoxin family protein [Belliella baltica]AFL82955.1 thioredoxin domain-containing protein [Belliella baltica DSM 15883]
MEITEKISMEEFQALLENHPATLIYFYQDKCGVCKTLFPKVKELLEQEFPKMEMLVLEAEQNRALAAQLRMLSVPGIMVYFEGKEFFRSNGLVTIGELDHRLRRLYEMFF